MEPPGTNPGSSQWSATEPHQQVTNQTADGLLFFVFPLAGRISFYDKRYLGVKVSADSDAALREVTGDARTMRVIVKDLRKRLVFYATLRAKKGHFVYLRLPRSVRPFYEHREKVLFLITPAGGEVQ